VPVVVPDVPVNADSEDQNEKAHTESSESGENADPHLRSTREIIRYDIEAEDGEIGHVEDFIVDIKDWVIRYFALDTRDFLPGKKVIISPDWIKDIEWSESKVSISMSQAAIRGCPEYNPSIPINIEYEERLYDYYGKPKYWLRDLKK
jgi:hypothetical protein